MYGKRLRELRISLGYTQKQLADRLGISAESVSMYELGKRRPQKEIQKRINHLFCVTDQYFSQETEKDRVEELMMEIKEYKKSRAETFRSAPNVFKLWLYFLRMKL